MMMIIMIGTFALIIVDFGSRLKSLTFGGAANTRVKLICQLPILDVHFWCYSSCQLNYKS